MKNLYRLLYLLILIWLSWVTEARCLPIENTHDGSELSSWQLLVFQGSKTLTRFMVRLRLEPAVHVCPYPIGLVATSPFKCPLGEEGTLLLSVKTVIMSLIFPQEKYEHFVWFRGKDLGAIQMARWRQGDSKWIKLYTWLNQGVHRLSIRPSNGEEALQEPFFWTRKRISIYERPEEGTCSSGPVMESATLIYLCSRLAQSHFKGARALCVFGKKRFHWVEVEFHKLKRQRLRYKKEGDGDTGRTIKERVDTYVYSIKAKDPEGVAEEEPFSLLGLKGDILIYVDVNRGIPVRIKGESPILGHLDMRLVSMK